MKRLLIIPLLFLVGCGTKIIIENCDNSLLILEQSSEQRTDNKIPISLTDASQVLKDLAELPKITDPDVEPGPEATVTPDPTPSVPIVKPEPTKTRFHHTTTGSSDGGKSLVMCPDETTIFDKCSAGSTDIPYHGKDNGRIIYWNMFEVPVGDIICTDGAGKLYYYKADKEIVYGKCD